MSDGNVINQPANVEDTNLGTAVPVTDANQVPVSAPVPTEVAAAAAPVDPLLAKTKADLIQMHTDLIGFITDAKALGIDEIQEAEAKLATVAAAIEIKVEAEAAALEKEFVAEEETFLQKHGVSIPVAAVMGVNTFAGILIILKLFGVI